jgi:hypothetical protein
VGRWQWTYIEGVGDMEFTPDRKIREAFPDGDDVFRSAPQSVGAWRLEGDTLVIIPDQEWLERLRRLDPQGPAQRLSVERHRILQLDESKLVCDDHYTLQRAR